MQDLSAAGLEISDLGASAQMHEPDPAKRAKHMDEARRFIDLAHHLHPPHVRVFPNQFVLGEDKHVTFARISDGLHELGEYARPSGLMVIVESHGEFRRPEDLLPILEGAKSKNVAFLWDAHHTCVEGEKPADTFARLGKYTRHTHLKDAVRPGVRQSEQDQQLGRTPHISRLVALAIKFQSLVSSGSVRNYRELAEVGHVSRPRLSQIMKLAQLAPEIQEKLLFLPPTLEGPDRVFERHLRFLATVVDWEKQKQLFRAFEAERAPLYG